MTYAFPVKTYMKAEIERRRLYLDYSCFLKADEKLAEMQVTIQPYTVDAPVTVSTGYVDATNKKIVMFVGGGAANTSYVLKVVVRTDAGQVKQDNIGMQVLRS